ncbi:MAG: TolC family protein, partial [Planctomycetaceae bacterium]
MPAITSRRAAALLVALAVAARAPAADGWPDPGGALRSADPGPALESPPADFGPAVVPDAVHGPSPRTLEEFVALAERSHPKLVAARAAVEAARGKAVQARLYPNPVAAGGSPQLVAPGSGAANGGNGASTQYYSIMSQDVVTAGKLRLSQQAALREVQKAEYDLIRARFDVLRDVRQGFYSLLVSQRRVEIYKQLLDIAKRSYEIGSQLAETGEGTKADVLFWSIERDRADVRLLNSAVLIETGRRQLAAAIGLSRADVGQVEADLFQRLPNFDLKVLQEAVVRANAKPQAAQADVARTQWELERAVVQPIPNVNLMGGYQREINYPPSNQGLFQVQLAVPLFDRNQGNIRTARADSAVAR